MSLKKLLIIFVSLFIVGVLMVIFVDTKGPEPDFECAADGEAASSFTDSSKNGCAVSAESYKTWSDWYGSPNYGKVAGLGIAAVGILGSAGVGIASLAGRSRRK